MPECAIGTGIQKHKIVRSLPLLSCDMKNVHEKQPSLNIDK